MKDSCAGRTFACNRWNMKQNCARIKIFGLAAAMLLPGASCVNDYRGEPDKKTETRIYLKFSMVTRVRNVASGGTRAADAEGDLPGSAAENEINLSGPGGQPDIRYFLFDADLKFLQDMSPESVTVAETADYIIYDVVAEITDDYFDVNLGGSATFYILAFANYGGWGGATVPAPGKNATIADFLSGNSGILLTAAPDSGELLRLTGDNDRPGARYFPMAGLQKYTVPRDMMQVAAPPDGSGAFDISLATGKFLNMLRSLAKIELVDKINVSGVYEEEKDGPYPWSGKGSGGNGDTGDMRAPRFRIDNAEVYGVMNTGSLFPDIEQWVNANGTETQQVTAPSIPEGSGYLLPPGLNADNTFEQSGGVEGCVIKCHPDRYATFMRDDRCPVFSAYIFEYGKAFLGTLPSSVQPYIRVTARGNGPDGHAETVTLPVRIASYTGGSASAIDNLDYLLRNHIYRFEVAGISGRVNVKWTVCEMDDLSTDIEFN